MLPRTPDLSRLRLADLKARRHVPVPVVWLNVKIPAELSDAIGADGCAAYPFDKFPWN